MHIANPIYDVVFKYLMEDSKVAKIILSAIIGEEIENLEFRPSEKISESFHSALTVYRIDFSARIKTKDGAYKQVIVEIQKAKYSKDIMRFRRYLGEQYANKDNINPENRWDALPIISIYFLGHELDNVKVPVLKVNRQYIDIVTGEELRVKENFIESLTHDSYIIQIPLLKSRRRNELEILLSIFDQGSRTEMHHILNVDDEDFPEEYGIIIRRLQRAASEKSMRDSMDIEDDVLSELDDKARRIEDMKEIVIEKNKEIEEKEKTIEEKEKTIEEKEKTIEEKEKALIEKDRIIHELLQKLQNN